MKLYFFKVAKLDVCIRPFEDPLQNAFFLFLQAAGPTVVEDIFNPSLSPFTTFAPIDSAFYQELIFFLTGLFGRNNRVRLENFVKFHMISGAMVTTS